MSSGEKKVAVVLVLILVAMVAAYVTTGNKKPAPAPVMAERMKQRAAGGKQGAGGPVRVVVNPGQSQGSAACPSGSAGAGGVATQEFGKKGAPLEVLALLPITHGCHVRTEEELKKAYRKHPDQIHLTIVDLFGADAAKYLPKVGNQVRAVVSINGKTKFQHRNRTVVLERMENQSYSPDDIGPIIEAELKRAR